MSHLKPTIEEVEKHFSGVIQISGNYSGKLQTINTDHYGVFFDGYHYRQKKDDQGNQIMLWSKENGFCEILTVKPISLKEIQKGQTVYLEPIGNNARHGKVITLGVVTNIKRKYFDVEVGNGREYTFSIDGGLHNNGQHGSQFKCHTTEYEAQSSAFSQDVRNVITRKLQKLDYRTLLKIQKLLQTDEDNK